MLEASFDTEYGDEEQDSVETVNQTFEDKAPTWI
mgnify:CR=1 FL=1